MWDLKLNFSTSNLLWMCLPNTFSTSSGVVEEDVKHRINNGLSLSHTLCGSIVFTHAFQTRPLNHIRATRISDDQYPLIIRPWSSWHTHRQDCLGAIRWRCGQWGGGGGVEHLDTANSRRPSDKNPSKHWYASSSPLGVPVPRRDQGD